VDAIQAIVLGIVQGLTEFLPISSTAHLRIVPAILGWDDPGSAFTAVVQLGTMLAVLIYFRADLWRIAKAWFAGLRDEEQRRTLDARLGWYIILGTIPIGIFGLLFQHPVEHQFRNLYLVGAALVVGGIFLAYVDITARRTRDIESLDARDATFIGFAQVLALIPGVSRSGSTISAGLWRGFTREAAARYSFLLSVPAVVLSGLFELKDVGEGGGAGAVPTVIAVILAFIVGYWSIAFLLRYLAQHTLRLFVLYRIGAGILVIALAAAGAIS